MNIRSVRLHPFAGIRDQSFEFKDGLNVLLGPNEAGKSTLFQALHHALFTPTSLTARQVENEVGRFFPVGGGDVIRVDLTLQIDDEDVSIYKTWKQGKRQGSAQLKLADGSEFTDDEQVQQRIETLLPVTPATLKTIFLSDQSGLQETIQQMKDDPQVRGELGSVLRKSVMETGGVSVDRFRDLIESRYEEYFKRWDRDHQYPENNKGIANPYKAGTGKIVEAYYKKEQAGLDHQHALEFEKELDAINEQISESNRKHLEKKEEFGRRQPLKKGIQQRRTKELELQNNEQELATLREINKQWPVFEDRLKAIDPEIKKADQQIEACRKELKKAEEKQKIAALRERVNKLEKLREEAETAKKDLEETPVITQEQIKELRSLRSELDRLQAQVDAAKLSVTLEGKVDTKVQWQEAGKESSDEVAVRKGKEEKRTASGGLTLETDTVRIQVFSGEGDIERIITERDEKQKVFNEQLGKTGSSSLQEAETAAQLYRDKQARKEQAGQRYQDELGEDDLLTLKKQLDEAGSENGVRESSEIYEELAGAKSHRDALDREKGEKEKQLDTWKEKFESHDKVIEQLGDRQYAHRKLKKEIDELPELPEGFDSSEEFVEYVDQLDKDMRALKDEESEKKLKREELRRREPDMSSEELERQQEEAEADFERVHQEGEVLARVREEAIHLMDSLDEQTYKGLETSFVRWLGMMSGERFKKVKLEQDLPERFLTSDDRELPFPLLSHGTKGTVALAWRFALCEHFLPDAQGVVVLDDPLVDMDPERRKAAVKGIQSFAERYQVVVMTCHPEHAEMMGEVELIK